MGSAVYLVKKNDNLYKIAKANNTSVAEILKLNPNLKKGGNLIFVGDEIKLPPKSAEDIDMTVPGFTVEKTKNDKPSVKAPEPVIIPKVKTNGDTPYTSAYNDTTANKTVSYIINNDKAKFKIDEERMTAKIVEAAKKADIKADSLAAIVKNETHFSEQIIISKNGKGPAGITSIVPKDMYQRPQVFDDKMKSLIKEYGSLQKIFQAKKTNPEMDLGEFGEMLYKYKSSDNLNAAVKKDFDLNLQVGAFYFKYKLKQAKGDEHTAFKNYNVGTASYARRAMETVNEARKEV